MDPLIDKGFLELTSHLIKFVLRSGPSCLPDHDPVF